MSNFENSPVFTEAIFLVMHVYILASSESAFLYVAYLV